MAITEAQVRTYLDVDEPNYQAAASALGPEALPVLERLVQDADALLASKAAYLASLIPGEASARVLERAARSEHPTVRVAAAAGLQRRPDVSEDVAAALIEDVDPGVRQIAGKATRARSTTRSRRAPGEAEQPAPGEGGGGGPQRPRTGPAGEAVEAGYAVVQPSDDEPSSGMGGGEIPGEGARSVSRDLSRAGSEEEDESGGGGELPGAGSARGAAAQDDADGGGLLGSAQGDSAHGGGQG
jgi:hypothetical protein